MAAITVRGGLGIEIGPVPAAEGGLVERMTLRLVVLRDFAGNVHFVRNGQIQVVTNMTKDYGRYVIAATVRSPVAAGNYPIGRWILNETRKTNSQQHIRKIAC